MERARSLSRALRVLIAGAVALAALSAFAVSSALAAPATTLYVSTSGSDAGACTKALPCATIGHAVGVAAAGATVVVAAGTYDEASIAIERPLTLKGAGPEQTIVDAEALPNTQYGSVRIDSGNVTVQGFTFTNPSPDNGIGEPFIFEIRNATGGPVTITHNRLVEGTADSQAGNDFPVGIDYYRDSTVASVGLQVDHNDFVGMWQGMILENPGPVSVDHNSFSKLIASGGYAAEGIFDLAYGSNYYWPTIPTVTDQTFSHNSFTGFSGYGVILEAGYPYDGYWGKISGVTLDHNRFDMQGSGNVPAISLFANNNAPPGASSISDVTIDHNTGTIETPGVPILQNPRGGTISGIALDHNDITVNP